MDAYRCVVTKRDLRSYTDRVIDRDVLLPILEAGRRSGSARNHQPWQLVVVTDREVMRRLARCGRYAGHLARAGAVVVIAVEGTRDLFDAGRCAQNLMLAGWSLGIASCPATLHDDTEVRRALALPDDLIVGTSIAFGYPDPRGRSRLERLALGILTGLGRKPLETLVHWEQYTL